MNEKKRIQKTDWTVHLLRFVEEASKKGSEMERSRPTPTLNCSRTFRESTESAMFIG